MNYVSDVHLIVTAPDAGIYWFPQAPVYVLIYRLHGWLY